eukprot:gene4291-7619_t
MALASGPKTKKPKMTDEEYENWKLLDDSLAEYDRQQRLKPKPKPKKAPSWADEDVDDDAVGFAAKPKPAPPQQATPTGFGVPA